ncbi:MAG: UbiX family flavin prenyltransferase [SAR324 cluster bacterium]|nr:UbiX family flavin prenyltransferase [SAR324 cluster bacterium]
MKKRIVVGISGASGVIYGIEFLRMLPRDEIEIHLVLSDAGRINIGLETEYQTKDVEKMADCVYNNRNLAAAISSGSFLTDGMVIVPCSIKTLSGIANSYTDNLLVRAADVTLKEKRKLILAIRETPLHKGHLQLMVQAADLGAHILPPIPSFYHNPKTIEDVIHQSIGKMFDYLQIEHKLFERWKSPV